MPRWVGNGSAVLTRASPGAELPTPDLNSLSVKKYFPLQCSSLAFLVERPQKLLMPILTPKGASRGRSEIRACLSSLEECRLSSAG